MEKSKAILGLKKPEEFDWFERKLVRHRNNVFFFFLFLLRC